MKATDTPHLSVVIPVRNGMPFIEEAVKSVLSQWTSGMELIVRDNRSTDGTLGYLASLKDSRIRIVESPESVSAAQNWTEACYLATGTYTKLLCADDTVLSGGLERQLRAALDNPRAVLIASRRRIIDEAGRTIIRSRGVSRLVGEHDGESAMRKAVKSGSNPFGEPSSVLFRTDILKHSLPFHDEEFSYLIDLDMYLRVLAHGPLVGLKSTDATFRLSGGSWSQSVGRRQLREYRQWRDKAIARGALKLNRRGKALSDFNCLANFLGRRVVTSVTGLVALIRR